MTRDCDLACLHCCTESAPGKRLPDELNVHEAMRLVSEIVRNEVPYVMLCCGEPLVVPHFLAIAEALANELLSELPLRNVPSSFERQYQCLQRIGVRMDALTAFRAQMYKLLRNQLVHERSTIHTFHAGNLRRAAEAFARRARACGSSSTRMLRGKPSADELRALRALRVRRARNWRCFAALTRPLCPSSAQAPDEKRLEADDLPGETNLSEPTIWRALGGVDLKGEVRSTGALRLTCSRRSQLDRRESW
jgi:organic radical activating enzyme